MKAYGGVDIKIHILLTAALAGGEWSALPPRKEPQYPLNRKLGGPQSSLDDVEKRKFLTLPRLELG
jgi:hypothetical protein